MNRPQPGNGYREPSIWLCLLLSILAHALLAWWIFPFDFRRKTPEARRGGERRILLVQRHPEPKQASPSNKEQPKKEPAWVKTSEDQNKARPREPDFIGKRNTSASGGRKQPDKKEGELLPDQDGIDRKNDITLFDQQRQEGDLAHDGKKGRASSAPSPAAPPTPPAPAAAPAPTPAPPSQQPQPTPPSPPAPPVPPAPSQAQPAPGSEAPNPTGNEVQQGRREGHQDAQERQPGRDDSPRQEAIASVRERKAAAEHKDLLTSPVVFNTQPSIPIPSFGSPQGKAQAASLSPGGATPSPRPSRPYDPSFTADSQPGFRTHERRTRTTGRFVFGSNASLNVASTPRGQYEELVYRRVAYFWYRECDANREMIVPGSIQIRVLVNTQGQITAMDLLRRTGASVSQQGFTFRAIRNADLPPMPQVVRDDVVGDKMELVFDFYFD